MDKKQIEAIQEGRKQGYVAAMADMFGALKNGELVIAVPDRGVKKYTDRLIREMGYNPKNLKGLLDHLYPARYREGFHHPEITDIVEELEQSNNDGELTIMEKSILERLRKYTE